MFEFTTQTILNQVSVATSAADAKSTDNIVTYTDKAGTPKVRIGNTVLSKDTLTAYQKKAYTPEHLTSVSFNMSKINETVMGEDKVPGIYRIALYLGLSMNSQDSFYANDFVYKGKPLYVEFVVKSTSESKATIADRVKANADKYLLFMAQEKILNVTVNGTEVKFEGVNGYQQIKKAVLQRFDEDAIPVDCCTAQGDFITKIEGVQEVWKLDDDHKYAGQTKKFVDGNLVEKDENTEEWITPGLEAFGDYNWIIHNLRLPTCANTSFWSPTKTEMPVAGGTYNQYIFTMCAERLGVAGEVVGHLAKSVTNHIFWVPVGTLSDNFETAVKDVLGDKATKDYKDADDKLDNPYNVTE